MMSKYFYVERVPAWVIPYKVVGSLLGTIIITTAVFLDQPLFWAIIGALALQSIVRTTVTEWFQAKQLRATWTMRGVYDMFRDGYYELFAFFDKRFTAKHLIRITVILLCVVSQNTGIITVSIATPIFVYGVVAEYLSRGDVLRILRSVGIAVLSAAPFAAYYLFS